MGKIDKEKLLEEFRGIGSMYLSDVRRVIKNFLEEQEIDFDAICKEFNEICLKKDCDNCSSVKCAFDFLKSKNLTVPKSVDIPVKKTWTLKKEYYDFAIDMLQPISLMQTTDKEPKHKQYYDLHEEPDYSKIPKGSIVECVTKTAGTIYDKIGRVTETQVWFNHYSNIAMSNIVSIRIVELAKEKV